MNGENIVSIELAVGAAAFVLGARLFALIQATRGVPDAHRQVVDTLSSGDLTVLESKARGLRYTNPYGELAGQLIEATRREAASPAQREERLDRSAGIARRRLMRRTQQGQAMDLVAVSVALGIAVFARSGLPAGPLFWSLAGAVMILLLSSIAARAQLQASVLDALEALRSALVARPQLPSLSDGPVDCFWCGERTDQRTYDILDPKSGDKERVLATICGACGKFVATIPADEPDSSVDPVSS